MSEEEVAHAPEYVTAHVRDALALDPRCSDQDVEVTVEGTTVRLDGLAPTPDHRDAVSDVARDAAGDFAVRNEMKVQTFPEDGSSEELA